MISIELSHTSWEIKNINLGQEVTFTDALGGYLPKITSKSNIAIMVDVGYVTSEGGWGQLRPGLDKEEDVFMTLVDTQPIPPEARLPITSLPIDPGDILSFPFTYSAPPALSQLVQGMKSQYEFRAYKTAE